MRLDASIPRTRRIAKAIFVLKAVAGARPGKGKRAAKRARKLFRKLHPKGGRSWPRPEAPAILAPWETTAMLVFALYVFFFTTVVMLPSYALDTLDGRRIGMLRGCYVTLAAILFLVAAASIPGAPLWAYVAIPGSALLIAVVSLWRMVRDCIAMIIPAIRP